MPDTVAPKRVVVQHPDGLLQIAGLTSAGQPKDFLTAAECGLPYPVNLVASRPRYWLYRAVQTPQYTLHPDQR